VTSGRDARSIDTPEGCRAHAVQDRARAGGADTDNGRLRLERSAAAWEKRAGELDALAETRDVRKSEAIAEWDEAERQSARDGGDDPGAAKDGDE
jgi:hypothetical protein